MDGDTQYCYILYNESNNKTYVGYTVNPQRRIRQHNGIIKGGARFTSRNNSTWKFLCLITSPDFTKNLALSFEWHVKHVKTYGHIGRLHAVIQTMIRNPKFNTFSFQIYISPRLVECISHDQICTLVDYSSLSFHSDISDIN
jgi:predicted GIY-YIG superfamily endonuclease